MTKCRNDPKHIQQDQTGLNNSTENIPDLLYKYFKPTTAALVLDSQRLLLQSPLAYNDPFDTQAYPIGWYSDHDFIERWKSRLVYHATNNQTLISPYISDDASKVLATIQGLHSQGRLVEIDLMLSSVVKTYSDPSRLSKIATQALAKTQRCTCLSTVYDSILMWSHYADDHKGCCLEFDRDLLAKSTVVDLPKIRPYTTRMQYAKSYPSLDHNELNDDELDTFILDHTLPDRLTKQWVTEFVPTKYEDWAYEQEVRITALVDPLHSKTQELHYLSLPRGTITKIYLGCRMDPQVRRQIVKAAAKMHPSPITEKMTVSLSDYKVIPTSDPD